MRIKSFLGDNLYIAALFIILIALTTMGRAGTIEDCVAKERARWSVIGAAKFIGEPWHYSWVTSREWDNVQGKMVPITSITNTLAVPGEALIASFDDGSSFVYGEPLTERNRVVWSDNLYSLKEYGMAGIQPPYITVKRDDGAVYLLRVKEDGSCGVGWYLGQPTK